MYLPARRSGRRFAPIVAAVAAAALVAGGCSESPSPDKASGNAATSSITVFNGATGTITENWNPFLPTQLQPTLGMVHEALFYYNLASDVPPKPMLATAFTWDTAGKVLTITTRPGVKWSDGQPFSAKDVAYTFQLIAKTPAINSNAVKFGKIEATNDTTVVINFPSTSFTLEPSLIGTTPIVPEHIWSKVADPSKSINPNPVGTGPYKFKSFSPQSYVLEKNPNYWQAGKPQIQTVRYISLATADAATASLVSGEIDWMSSFMPGLDKILKDKKELSYVNTPALTTSIFTCSNADLGCKGPQTDAAVRKAIYYAINRDQLNKLAGGGFAAIGSPTLLLPDRDQKWIADPANLKTPSGPDVAKSNQLLDAAGWAKGADGIRAKSGQRLSLTIQTVTGWSDYISLNDSMTQALKEVGIELKPTQLSYNEWNNNEVQGKYQLSLDSIGLGASTNPYFTYNPKYSSATTAKVGESAQNQGNYSRYKNPIVDQAVLAAAATNDEATQKQEYAKIQTEIIRDMPYIPIYVNSTLTEFNTSRATGWPTNDNKYAFPATWKSWDNGVVMAELKPAS